MSKKSAQKCRTCLKSNANISVENTATGCSPGRTYSQLLKEFVKLESNSDFESFMPQYLCFLCCRELKNIYCFIKKAQYCNEKLINVISKRLQCLQTEQTEDSDKTGSATLIKKEENDEEKYPNSENVSADVRLGTMDNNDESGRKFESTTEANTNVIRCPECEESFCTHYYLKQHMSTHHDIDNLENLETKPCPTKYNSNFYIYHLIRKHKIGRRKRKEILKPKIIKCRSCDYTARTHAALSYHRRSKHGSEKDKLKCKFCKYICLKKFDLFIHIKNVHKELIKTLKTEAGNRQVKEPVSDCRTLAITKATEEDNSDKEYSNDAIVPLAKRACSFKTTLREDEEQSSGEEFVRSIVNLKKRKKKSSTSCLARKCEQCGNVYKDKKALYAHKKNVHISEDKYSLCAHCGKRYKRKIDLRIHIERDHIPKNPNETTKPPAKVREKRFMCTECSYVCTTITILNIHINRKHTGVKPYKCDICFKSFIVPYDLKIHRYLHTGERPFKCPICSKGFRDKSHMVKHKRIHSSEKPYECKECGKCFTLAYYLTVHNRKHLKERNLNCVTCGKVFENRSLLSLHRINENHHDEVE